MKKAFKKQKMIKLKSKTSYLIICIFLFFCYPALASDERKDLEELRYDINGYATDLEDPGILPGSMIYFLDSLGESVGVGLTRYPDKKTTKAIKYSEEKMAELVEISTSNNDDDLFFLDDNIELYEKNINVTIKQISGSEDLGVDLDNEAIDVARKTLLFAEIAEKIYDLLIYKEKLGAAEDVRKVFKKSLEGYEGALQGIRKDPTKREELSKAGIMIRESYEMRFGELTP